jgi:hypothetical protein
VRGCFSGGPGNYWVIFGHDERVLVGGTMYWVRVIFGHGVERCFTAIDSFSYSRYSFACFKFLPMRFYKYVTVSHSLVSFIICSFHAKSDYLYIQNPHPPQKNDNENPTQNRKCVPLPAQRKTP